MFVNITYRQKDRNPSKIRVYNLFLYLPSIYTDELLLNFSEHCVKYITALTWVVVIKGTVIRTFFNWDLQ